MTAPPRSRSPVDTLTDVEIAAVHTLAGKIGEDAARAALGRLNRTTFYKAVAGLPVARVTATVMREHLSRVATDKDPT